MLPKVGGARASARRVIRCHHQAAAANACNAQESQLIPVTGYASAEAAS